MIKICRAEGFLNLLLRAVLDVLPSAWLFEEKMTRKKNYAQQRLGWHRDPRCMNMKTPATKWLNSILWSLCVEHRCDTLPAYFNEKYLAEISGIDARTISKSLTIMCSKMCNLIRINGDSTITVFGVREVHESAKYPFKDTLEGNDDNINIDKNVTKMHTKTSLNRDTNINNININKKNNTKSPKEEIPETDEAREIVEMFPGMKTINTWIEKWTKSIPLGTIFEEVKNASEWQQNQPEAKKRKSANPTAFLTRWLARYQENPQSSKTAAQLSPRDQRIKDRGTDKSEIELQGLYDEWIQECKDKGINHENERYPFIKPLVVQ